jgi:hypothetical protein
MGRELASRVQRWAAYDPLLRFPDPRHLGEEWALWKSRRRTDADDGDLRRPASHGMPPPLAMPNARRRSRVRREAGRPAAVDAAEPKRASDSSGFREGHLTQIRMASDSSRQRPGEAPGPRSGAGDSAVQRATDSGSGNSRFESWLASQLHKMRPTPGATPNILWPEESSKLIGEEPTSELGTYLTAADRRSPTPEPTGCPRRRQRPPRSCSGRRPRSTGSPS